MTYPYEIGAGFIFAPNQAVICNGYPGTVIRMYSDCMVEVRLASGVVCVSACYPDCYPAPEGLYLIQIEELDTYTNKRKRYYMKDASDVRRCAIVPLKVAQHCVANMGNDFRYRRHATMVKMPEKGETFEGLARAYQC